MALKTSKLSEIPAGEIPISKSEAVNFQLDIMETLCPPNKRVFLNHGYLITSMAAAANCIYLHFHYRKTLNVLFQGRFLSVFPGVILPAGINIALHQLLITENILVQKWACPVCYHLRSGLINLTSGSVYPAIVAPVIAASYARRIKLDVPPVNTSRGIRFLLEKMKPISSKLGIFACFQFLVGVVIAELETKENNDFNNNINKYVKEYQERIAKENMKSERLVSRGSP